MKLIYLVILSILLFSCDDLEQTVDFELPYEEKLVIDGNVSAGMPWISVIVTKTIPPLEDVTPEKVSIKDAECKVYYEDKVIDLEYSGGLSISSYTSVDSIDIKVGVEYRLEVKWNGKTAIARTTIPKMPEIKSVNAEEVTENGWTQTMFNFEFEPEEKGVLQLRDDFQYDQGDAYLFNETDRSYTVKVEDYTVLNNRDSVYYLTYYDVEYYNYYTTRYQGDSDGGIFGSSGLNIEGNVEGDDAIGLWIGLNSKRDTISKYLKL